MKDNGVKLGLALLALLVGLWSAGASAQAPSGDLDFQAVYEELDRSGRWYEHPRYGRVWAPDVDPSWRPYTRGQWVNTEDYGWYWESDERFGWAVYHYGRWFLDERHGWSWVPGNEWGPAWVAWRTSEEDVGWAALPPEAEYADGQLSLAESTYDNPRFSPAWCFVPVGLLVAPRIWERLAPASRNGLFLGRTRVEPFERSSRGHFFNRGIEPRRWERMTGFRVDTRPTVAVGRSREVAPSRGGAVQIYRPRVTSTPPPGRSGGAQPEFERRGNPRTWPSDQQHQAAPTQPQQPQFERRGNPRNWPSDQQHQTAPPQHQPQQALPPVQPHVSAPPAPHVTATQPSRQPGPPPQQGAPHGQGPGQGPAPGQHPQQQQHKPGEPPQGQPR